ncbi:MAG: 4a-hydroxytetrahydrobiopterin dehydratase [Acidobacteria bacterium]|nr:MAG: 4a-hydroxytetrahydrobiopterin dehydratase [Acidobacteriota bacterium]REK00136.1 MAG: 4a-hydroxytetrahydrobiopterin dehydratase [Acidobacteriota bacterium]
MSQQKKKEEPADRVLRLERVHKKLTRYRGWDYDDDLEALVRTYEFPSFPAAIRFVAYVAELAELAQHHPDIDIRYSRVKMALSTHDAGGITDKDFDLIDQIDQR